MNFITRHVNASVWNVSLDRFDSRTLFRCRIIEAFSFVSKKAWLSSDKSLTPSGWEPHVTDSLQFVSMTAVKLRLLIFTSENLRLPRCYDEPKNSCIFMIQKRLPQEDRVGRRGGVGGAPVATMHPSCVFLAAIITLSLSFMGLLRQKKFQHLPCFSNADLNGNEVLQGGHFISLQVLSEIK